MLGLSWIGVFALLTSGNEYGSVIAENRKIVKKWLNRYFTNKRMETYHNMLLDMTETGIKYSTLCYKMETYLDENHEITNDEGFAYCYMSLKKFEDFNVRYFKIAKSLTRVEVGNDSITVNFDKNFEKEYNMYRLFVNLINYRFRILEEKYGIHKEEQEGK